MRADDRSTRRRMTTITLLVVSTLFAGACVEDGVNLPTDYNTQRFREIKIDTQKNVTEPGTELMRPLNGMHGSPYPIVPTDGDLSHFYWRTPDKEKFPDGARVSLVRLGTGTDCRVSLEGIYGGGTSDTEDESKYDFAFLDFHVDGIDALQSAEVMWQAALTPDSGAIGCNANVDGYQQRSPLLAQDANTVVRVAFNTLRHLRNDGATGGFGTGSTEQKRLRWVEFMDDPGAYMGYSGTGNPSDGQTDYTVLFDTYRTFAKLVKDEWPNPESDGRPVVAVGGISFTVSNVSDLDYLAVQDAHPIIQFIDHCKKNDSPLDFLSFKTKTRHPSEVAVIAQKLSDELHADFPEAVLVLTGVDIDDSTLTAQAGWVAQDQLLRSSYRGAFQSAARIYLQDVTGAPVKHMVAGRGPRVLNDLLVHENEGLEDLYNAGLLTRSDYFAYLHGEANPDLNFYDEDQVLLGHILPLPAFMNLFPFRQVSGHQRVSVLEGTDGEGMAVVATHNPSSTDVLHVIIANANVSSGAAQIVYELELSDFLPQTVAHVDYHLATLNHTSLGIRSFQFSENGIAEAVEGTGNVRFVHEMAVPSVHYIQFVKPTCDLDKPCGSEYECSVLSGGTSGFCVPKDPAG